MKIIVQGGTPEQFKRLEMFVQSCLDGATLVKFEQEAPARARAPRKTQSKFSKFNGKSSNDHDVFKVGDLVVAFNASHRNVWRVIGVKKESKNAFVYELETAFELADAWVAGKRYPESTPVTDPVSHPHSTALGNDNLREFVPDQLAPSC
jgi:hypothetical protein